MGGSETFSLSEVQSASSWHSTARTYSDLSANPKQINKTVPEVGVTNGLPPVFVSEGIS